MDIYSIPGTKVKFVGSSKDQVQWGSHDDPEGLLIFGQEYTIDHTEVHSSYTKVYLKEFPSKHFNSCLFE